MAAAAAEVPPQQQDGAGRLDSLEQAVTAVEQKVLSTLMFGGSAPVSFSGETRVKLNYHHFNVYPGYIRADNNYLASGWEGNESLIRLAMVVRPGRNTVLWSKIGFQHTMPGNRAPSGAASADGFRETQTRHDKSLATANIHEDMSAGIAIRTIPASFWLKMGNVMWTEASPFTIWKSQPRTFAWEYLPFEIEQPIARYYEYNIAKGEKAGRAAWHKKPFNGINLESISLPFNLYVNILYGTFERYDNFEREYTDFSNDLAYAGEGFPVKASGVGDSYRHLFHARIAGVKALKGLTPGLNVNAIRYSDDVVYSEDANGRLFLNALGVRRVGAAAAGAPLFSGRAFYKEPRIVSADIRGPAGELFDIHADAAASWIDTTWLIYDSTTSFVKEQSRSGIAPAAYSRIGLNARLPLRADIAAIAPGFYSPFSFAVPAQGFYAFGSNLVGSGKFIGRGEASPYAQNMAGVLLSAMPKLPGYGHLRVSWGQHLQLTPQRDVLYFPYRLNGQDFSTVFHSSYNRWGNGQLDHSIANVNTLTRRWYQVNAAYQKRMGDESFVTSAWNNPVGPEAGGLWCDYLSTYESFVPYEDSLSAAANKASISNALTYERTFVNATGITIDTMRSGSAFVPARRKYTFNLDLDAAYDIGPLLGYGNDLFVGGYAAINGVSTAFKPLAVDDKAADMLLWSLYLRFEPAIALAKQFYLLGLVGYENWRSQKAWMAAKSTGEVMRIPIDYRDAAYGAGFDWGCLDRMGLHGRVKWMKHTDTHYRDNDWHSWVISGEIKMWF